MMAEVEELRVRLAEAERERDHFRKKFYFAWAALTPASEAEKRGMERVLAILKSKQTAGTGPTKGEFGQKWTGRNQAFAECAEMLRLAVKAEAAGTDAASA